MSHSRAVGQIVKAYHAFVLHRGQSEVRRLGRFIESSRHRITDEPILQQPVAAQDDGPFRTVSYSQTSQPQEPEKPTFLKLMGQLRQYPGLIRRVALAISCQVDVDSYDKTLSINAPSHFQDLVPSGEIFDGAASLVIMPAKEADLSKTKTFVPLQTACALGQLDSMRTFFRARPRFDKSFFGPGIDDSGNPTNARQLSRACNILPTSLYTATQDDIGLVSARAHNDLIGSTNNSQQSSVTRTDCINLYANPRDKNGNPIPLADWLHDRLEDSGKRNAAIQTKTAMWFRKLDALQSKIQFASLHSAPSPPLLLIRYSPDLYAEQLMQGYAVYIRPEETSKKRRWRSVCRRLVEVGPSLAKEFARLRLFEEEGAVSTSVSTAAKPLVGIVLQDSEGSFPTIFDLEVIGVNNTKVKDSRCICLPDPEIAPTELQIGGLFRKKIDIDKDLQVGDFALVTPKRNKRECTSPGQYRVFFSELLIYPVFHGFQVPLAKEGELWLLAAKNEVPRPASAPVLTPRDDERFPIMLNKYATRYLDKDGDILKRSAVAYFTVEGDRRYFALPWVLGKASPDDKGNSRIAFKRLESIVVDIRAKNVAAVLSPMLGVANGLGSADLVSVWHLTQADRCQVATIPKPLAPGLPSNALISCDDLPLDESQIGKLIWVLPESVVAAAPTRHLPTHPRKRRRMLSLKIVGPSTPG